MMKLNRITAQIVALAFGLIVLGVLGAYWPALVRANPAASTLNPLGPAATIEDAINYQGYLRDDKGNPLSGSFTMRFQIYNSANGGSLLYDSGNTAVSVTNGLFTVQLPIANDIFNGEELWLAQTIEGELLSPRQALLPAPLAHGLRPGAVIKGTASAITNNYNVEVHMNNDTFSFNRGAIAAQSTTGNAIFGLANNGRAVYGQTQDGYAVYGFDGGSLPNRGYGGYFYSTNGIGIYGYSGANRANPNIYAPGVYGQSNQGVGVYGRGDTSNSHTFYNEGGRFEGGDGVRGTGDDTFGYGGVFYGNYRGIYARSNGNTNFDGYFGGTQGISTFGVTDRSAADQAVVINLGSTPIEPGDLVAMAGVFESPENGQMMLGVAAVNAENAGAIIGVARERFAMLTVPQEDGSETIEFSHQAGTIQPQDFLAIITEGLAPAVNLSSLPKTTNLAIGDKIAVSTSGEMTQGFGTSSVLTLGRIAGAVNPENGTVPMFIDID